MDGSTDLRLRVRSRARGAVDAGRKIQARSQKRRKPTDTRARPASSIAPNLLNHKFEADQPDHPWIADFKMVWVGDGWLYVAVVPGLFSRPLTAGTTLRWNPAFSSMKCERVNRYCTGDEARADLFSWIERVYNLRRRHSSLGYLRPLE